MVQVNALCSPSQNRRNGPVQEVPLNSHRLLALCKKKTRLTMTHCQSVQQGNNLQHARLGSTHRLHVPEQAATTLDSHSAFADRQEMFLKHSLESPRCCEFHDKFQTVV